MNEALLALLLLSAWTFSSAAISNLFSVVVETSSQNLYLLFKDTYREIPDIETAETLGFSRNNIRNVTRHELQGMRPRFPAVGHLKNDRSNPDAVMATERGRFMAIFPKPILYDFELVCDGGCKNPSLVPWYGQMIAISEVTRLKGDLPHHISLHPHLTTLCNAPGDELRIFWVNTSLAPLVNSSMFGVTTQPNNNVGGATIPGTDARIAVHPDSGNLIVVHYPRFRHPSYVGYAELAVATGLAMDSWCKLNIL